MVRCAVIAQFSVDHVHSSATYPVGLLVVFLWHLLPYSFSVAQCPSRQLLKNTNLVENIKIRELVGLFLDTKRVPLRRFGDVLSTSILVEYLKATSISRATLVEKKRHSR